MTELEFTYVNSKIVGNDTIVFRLEDGAQVVVKVDMARCGSRLNEKGETDYHFEFVNHFKIIPAKKKFKLALPNPKAPKDYTR